eukprot:TRINITY_DN25201_c0_g1_i2.p1 TRINITY_DN25201_c0_g1~~TRINITY_DN25201_c0_g1_i2.p1  ORF type:complete len:786 (-),score=169.02 TRINITY_DN25201_c0_g1_i2:16-2373(-)
MPPLRYGGVSFLISLDDLALVSFQLAIVQVFWLLLDTTAFVQKCLCQIEVRPVLLWVDAQICLVVCLLDVLNGVLASQGAVMEKRRHEGVLKCLYPIRVILAVPAVLIYGYIVLLWTVTKLENVFGRSLLNSLPAYGCEEEAYLHGWGPGDIGIFGAVLAAGLVLLRLGLALLLGLPLAMMILAPRDAHLAMGRGLGFRALRLAGCADVVLQPLVKVINDVCGDGTADIATPSDLAFGLMLLAARQQQGLLATVEEDEPGSSDADASELESGAIGSRSWLASAQRASTIAGVRGRPLPLRASSASDVAALRETVLRAPCAIAIYGVAIDLLDQSVLPGTTWLSAPRALRALKRSFCGAPAEPAGYEVIADAAVDADCCGGLNERALRHVLADAARRLGSSEPELLWATWENRGPGTSPPLALLLDEERRQVLIAVRGTMDIKDTIADLGAEPVFFDPLGEAGPECAREPPFRDSRDFFVHSTMLKCAEDALARLQENGLLADVLAPGQRAHGWEVVCLGHSLGAGVACLLALMLRGGALGAPASNARCIGFEPPGGLVSWRLAHSTARLGFLAAVCANDLVCRLSVRSVQEIREYVLDELAACDRSKLQLALLGWSNVLAALSSWCSGSGRVRRLCCCPVRAFARLLLRCAGGPLQHDATESREHCMDASTTNIAGRKGHARLRTQLNQPSADAHFFSELWPAGRILYFRPAAYEWWCGGFYELATRWVAEWVQPEDLHEIIVSSRSLELHFPNIIRFAYASAAAELGAIAEDASSEVSESEASE